MSIKSATYIALFLILFLIFGWAFSAQMPTDNSGIINLLLENLERLKSENRIVGEISSDSDGIFGDLYIITSNDIFDSYRPNIIRITFEGKKFTLEIDGSIFHAPFLATMIFKIKNDSLYAKGRIAGKEILADLDVFTTYEPEIGYDLHLDATLYRVNLKGEIETLLPSMSRLFWSVERKWANEMGFKNLLLSVKGDSCINFQGLDLQALASLDFRSGIAGDREGFVRVEKGEIIRFGKSFELLTAESDFATGEIYARAERNTSAYIKTNQTGAVLQNYNLTLRYFGSFPDSVKWILSSEPELTLEEIISLLVRGDPYSHTISGMQVNSMEDRIKLTMDKYNSERFTYYTEKQVGRLLAMDRVEIEGESFSLDSPYEADKELSQRLRLSFRGTVGGTTEQTVSFNYRLLNNFYLINETNQNGETGIDLRYMIRFR